jgi:N-methylhydantoinase B
MNPDPITLELMRNRWTGVAEEMCAALIRTSYSTNIKDRRDCSAAIAQISGEILAQAESGVPLHLGNMPGVISSILKTFPVETMLPGDMYITNLPYPEGPGHLPDVSLVSAIFHDDKPVALAASTAHHVDMGGFAPGSMPFGVTEIYQEGLQIPPLRMFTGGKIEEPLFKLINQNVRTQYEVRGDLMAQFACGQIGQQRVSELFYREDPTEILDYMDEIQLYAERRMRAGINQLPDGDYSFEDFLDDDGVTDKPIKIKVKITISEDTFRADFTGSNQQVLGPLNARLSAARACVYYVCKSVVDPDLPACAGAYRPIEVYAPEGSILQATYPAAIGNANILTDQRVVDVLLGALYPVIPDRVCAACSGEMNLVNIGGIDPASGLYYNYVETYGGGQGAMFDLDGEDGVHTHLTNTRNAPIEIIERTYPLQVVRYGLIPDTEGAGHMRGGCGMMRELKCLGDRTMITLGSDRRKFTPWGLAGGSHAQGAHCYITPGVNQTQEIPTKTNKALSKNNLLHIETPGGGGWGDAKSRDTDRLECDIKNGLITSKRAGEIYGYEK